MLTPAEWRKQSLCFRKMAEDESDPHLKVRLVQHARALATLAMKLEREKARRDGTMGELSRKSRIADRFPWQPGDAPAH
jgi:hypothetical protein